MMELLRPVHHLQPYCGLLLLLLKIGIAVEHSLHCLITEPDTYEQTLSLLSIIVIDPSNPCQ